MAFALEGPTLIEVEQGKSATAMIRVLATSRPYRNVSLSVGELPSHLTVLFSPTSGKPTFQSRLTVTAAPTGPIGFISITIKARDAKGTKTMSMFVNVGQMEPRQPPGPTEPACTINVTSAAELSSALSSAVAGDVICLADGTYTGQFTNSAGNSGTAGNLITLRAQNPRQAILKNSFGTGTTIGLNILKNYWKIDGIAFEDHQRALRFGTTGTAVTGCEVVNCTFYNWGNACVFLQDASNCIVKHNAIGHGFPAADSPGIFLWNSDNNTVENNVVWATGNNGYAAGGDHQGYGVYVTQGSDSNLIRGNIIFANGGKGVMRLFGGTGHPSLTLNVVRDNIILWGEGEHASNDCLDDFNEWHNNLVQGVYQFLWNTKGNDTGLRGTHTLRHNTFIIDAFTRSGINYISGGCGGTKVDNILKDNLFYSVDTMNNFHILLEVNGASALDAPDYNLFFAPGSSAGWVSGYSYQTHDVTSEPTFNNAAAGDYTLAGGSPGKNAASDGADIGLAYNSFITAARIANVFNLPTAQNNALQGSTSTSFTVSPDHYYQVYFWIPSSGFFTGTETFTIEGVGVVRNLGTLTGSTTWISSAARWFTLGKHKATDGTLNISWTDANSADKMFIRKLPTTAEAYAWL